MRDRPDLMSPTGIPLFSHSPTPAPASAKSGFSLIEITIALGIIAFALVAIMGLFPIAMGNALESQRETRAAFIAQSIFSDLAAGSGPTDTFVASSTNFTVSAGKIRVNLSANTNIFLLFTEEGIVRSNTTAAAFSNSVTGGGYGAKVMITTNATFPNLSRTEIQVEAPVGAISTNRTKYNFVTFMRNK